MRPDPRFFVLARKLDWFITPATPPPSGNGESDWRLRHLARRPKAAFESVWS